MQINAALRVKQAAIIEQPCIIADIMELPESEYASLYQDLLKERGCFLGMKDIGSYVDGQRCCVLVLGEGQEDGILIDTQGTACARHSAFISNARTLVKVHTRELADHLISEGTHYTEDGRWSVSYEDLYEHYGAYITDTNGNGRLLKAELERRDEVNELIMTEDCIEIAYHLEYCDHCQEGGIEGAMDLLGVVGCNLYDEHDSLDDDGPVQTM